MVCIAHTIQFKNYFETYFHQKQIVLYFHIFYVFIFSNFNSTKPAKAQEAFEQHCQIYGLILRCFYAEPEVGLQLVGSCVPLSTWDNLQFYDSMKLSSKKMLPVYTKIV